ncbi:serine/threonine-protein kinase [Anatilimnocola sp. NA78]|uniref:serine/threonine-protein kinase n=1 Tax=Anatilimnocola sp. NA78 TaxID=3415683 RepID=UPI003CE59E2F
MIQPSPQDIAANEHEEQLAMLIANLADRAQQGEQIDLEGQCREHPKFAADLRELWGAVIVAQVAGKSSSIAETIAPSRQDSSNGSLELPSQLGDYELLEELGRGGMGVVFRARQESLHREVAIKMILRGQLARQAERERFQAEAQAAAKLDHPGIVPVYEVGEIEGRPYFSMKFIRGTTLAQRLSEGPMHPREAAKLLVAVARAIHFAHEKGVLHRDLKPSNILLDEQGMPHVTDFGLAKQITDDASLTKTGAILGTPAYMAPEQAAGNRGQVGPTSDVYSLGVVLYHMLTGRPPFQGASPVETVLMVLEQDPVPPRMLNQHADRDLEMICLRCLQKPTDLRYASAAALARDLDAYLNDESISARSGRFAQVLAGWMRETHHAQVLENWGLLWMWHSLVLFLVCCLTNVLELSGDTNRWHYFLLWTAGLGTWAAVFWALRRRMGPVTFVERQIAHIWAGSMISIALLFPLEYKLGLDVLELSPMLGIINGMAFLIKAGMLTGAFYVQAIALFATAALMAQFPEYAHFIFGAVAAACFFFPGMKYYRQRLRALLAAIRKGAIAEGSS